MTKEAFSKNFQFDIFLDYFFKLCCNLKQRVAAEIIAHPFYTSPEIIENDIAIIRVNHPFKFEKHIQKICMDDGTLKVHENGCFATGWGSESNENQGQFSQYLKKVQMDQVAKDSCEKDLRIALEDEKFILSENFFCAGGNANDLCVGDTGKTKTNSI